jgi:hypothetical protein
LKASPTVPSQLAIKYAAKMRRVGLAERLGKLTMELQEREEELEESQHVFAPFPQQQGKLLG